MKKILKAFVLLLFTPISTSIFAQLDYDKWEVVETVDDFGDPTGESVARYFSKGTFSNSATTGEDMIVKLVDYGIKDDGSGTAQLDFYEYNKNPASLAYDTEKGIIKMKMPDNSVKTLECYALKSGGLAFWGEFYTELMAIVNNGKSEKIKIVVNESSFGDTGSSKYNGYFHTKAADQVK